MFPNLNNVLLKSVGSPLKICCSQVFVFHTKCVSHKCWLSSQNVLLTSVASLIKNVLFTSVGIPLKMCCSMCCNMLRNMLSRYILATLFIVSNNTSFVLQALILATPSITTIIFYVARDASNTF